MSTVSDKPSPLSVDVESTVAKLLAKENIRIHRSHEYHTASFDILNRVLQLPILKDSTKNIQDLFIGHEVGHALFTSPKDFDRIFQRIGSKQLYNILEDIRIEKLIRKSYPGLIRIFRDGYSELVSREFFGDREKFNEYGFLDRLNLYAKTGDTSIEFDEEELPILKKALSINTVEDLIEVADLIKDKLKKEEDEDLHNHESDSESDDEGEGDSEETQQNSGSGGDEDDLEESQQDSGSDSGNDEDDLEESQQDSGSGSGNDLEETDQDSDSGNDEGDLEESQRDSGSGNDEDDLEESQRDSGSGNDEGDDSESRNIHIDEGKEENDPFHSETESIFSESLKNNLDDDGGYKNTIKNIEGFFPSKSNLESNLKSYESILKEFYSRNDTNPSFLSDEMEKIYSDFSKKSRSFVNNLSSEFLRKRSAFESNRSYVSSKGVINVNSLHKYKYSDDIFSSVVNTPTAKSHGLIFLIDFSGSMFKSLQEIVEKTIILTTFCKKVNIPFEVYGYTSFNGNPTGREIERDEIFPNNSYSNLRMYHLFSSRMKSKQFLDMSKFLLLEFSLVSKYGSNSTILPLSMTPTTGALLYMEYIIPEFRKLNNLQVVNLMVLTDGEPNDTFRTNSAKDTYGPYNIWFTTPSKKRLKISSYDSIENCKTLIKHFRENLRVHTIGFYICDQKDRFFRRAVRNSKDTLKSFSKDGMVSSSGFLNYEKYIFLNSREKKVKEVEEGMSKAQMIQATKSQGQSRRLQKIVSRELMETICENFS